MTNGELSAFQIRSEMFIGHDRHPTACAMFADAQHIIRFRTCSRFGARRSGIFVAGNARGSAREHHLRVPTAPPVRKPTSVHR